MVVTNGKMHTTSRLKFFIYFNTTVLGINVSLNALNEVACKEKQVETQHHRQNYSLHRIAIYLRCGENVFKGLGRRECSPCSNSYTNEWQ